MSGETNPARICEPPSSMPNTEEPQKGFAFSGIAQNSSFRDSLPEMGFQMTGFLDFPDHHPYDRRNMDAIIEKARAFPGTMLVTTNGGTTWSPYAGAARDFVLGANCVSGTGEWLRFGGQVMKNVAGYEVTKLRVLELDYAQKRTVLDVRINTGRPVPKRLKPNVERPAGERQETAERPAGGSEEEVTW